MTIAGTWWRIRSIFEMAGSIAPGAKIANFYFPASLQYATPASTTDADLADDFANELSNALAYKYWPNASPRSAPPSGSKT